MTAKGIKLITRVLLGVLLGVVVCILGCVAAVAISDGSGQAPMRSLQITIDVNRREELFTQLRGFAEKHGFEILIREVKVHPDGIYIYMSRYDLKIQAHDISDSPPQIIIWFYNRYPALPASRETVDELYKELKAFIIEIPDVTITEKLRRLSIIIDRNQREELFTQLRKFADKHSLEFTSSFSSDKTVFLLEIYGDGFHITSQAVTGSPREINIDFYTDINNESPTPIAQGIADELLNDLKSFLGEIPNVTITEEK